MIKWSLLFGFKGGVVVLVLLFLVFGVFVQVEEGSGYEIICLLVDCIWWLNKDIGEVFVCMMEGDCLICMILEDVVVLFVKSYEEFEVECEVLEKECVEVCVDECECQFFMFDWVFEMVCELVGMVVENDVVRDVESFQSLLLFWVCC